MTFNDQQEGSVINQGISWDEEVDVVVVGFGGAGACAAIEAAENGLEVLVLERFNGGGATRNSGGIIYAGGGTTTQLAAGIEDSPDNMFAYLKGEVGEVISEEALRAFCEGSPEMIGWLEDQGVRFDPSLCPVKTSYPPNRYYLYYSGNELIPPHNERVAPAPRGHRPKGKGMSGALLFRALKAAALGLGVRVRYQSRVQRLLQDETSSVVGLVYNSVEGNRFARFTHRFLSKAAYVCRYLTLIIPEFNRVFERLFAALEGSGKPVLVRARRGVVLAAGGYVFNQEMVRQHAPAYGSGTPLGTLGDDGSGIRLGQATGGVVDRLAQVSAWRFLNPPEAFLRGVLVDVNGERICNEEIYGAQMGDLMVRSHDGQAWLVIDLFTWRAALRETLRGGVQWFQTVTGLVNLFYNRRKAGSIGKLAQKCGIDPGNLQATLARYNQRCRSENPDPLGKSVKNCQSLLRPPFYAVHCGLKNRLYPCTTLTLGGLAVDEWTCQVLRADGSDIRGLYAVGRNASGLPSNGYVSGLSIAHCIHSGRLAGRHAAGISDP
jgi:3-oxo-5alpha-steroid 4-dehydrogenase